MKYVEHARSLVIRAHGMEMIEIRPKRDPELMKWIAARMREALRIEPGAV